MRKDVVIVGAGPVGLFSVFQCGMLGMNCAVIDPLPHIGGQCAALYPEKPIYDIPGFPEISGAGLIENLRLQAAPFQPEYILNEKATLLRDAEAGGFVITTSAGREISCKVVIIAAGAGAFGPNRPPLNNILEFEGVSVFYAVTDRMKFADKRVVIAGGGDSAADWAVDLSEIAEKVYVVHRRDSFRAAPATVEKMKGLARQGVIEFCVPAQLTGLQSENSILTGVEIRNDKGEKRILDCDVLLPFYGISADMSALSDWIADWRGTHIPVHPVTAETARPGVFCIGDAAIYEHKLKLILTGFAEAAGAAHRAFTYVNGGKTAPFEYSTSKGKPSV